MGSGTARMARYFILFPILLWFIISLQVQGDARDVVDGLLQLLSQFTVAAAINDGYDAADEYADDIDDPADYPGLFTNNVSFLMLLLPLTMMCG